MIRLILPYPPSVNRLWRASKTGRVYNSPKYKEWRVQAMWAIKEQCRTLRVTGMYKMTLLAVRPDRSKRDIGNLEKAVSDVLTAAKIVEDDSLCGWIDMRWVEKGPECLIIVEPMDEELYGKAQQF